MPIGKFVQNSYSAWTFYNLKKKAEMSYESLVNVSRRYIQEEFNSYQRCCESLKCRQVVIACTVKGTAQWAVHVRLY